ncbi:hypothetical protein NT2_05_02120 [Caenibius tardaugens NBRC 16725]|uniref:DUF3060 domain-containing protein n=1 Tax=Caenibius tardaugens NBRC 16725 TaxID=1219035 RepID=U2YLL7_9SPHN|nr:DUF3060 domain-containing protein [Caenibius tardaugens]GAD49292.1 hypothetical protein NT2_05_02120 [Caenibius tardaugens NBRC 16725]
MRLIRRVTVMAVAAVGLASLSAYAQDSFQGAGQNSQLDCAGKSAEIVGADNDLVITGACQRLEIQGASNRIRVDMAKNGIIEVTGASNTIHWTTPDGSRPRLRVTGAANRISGKAR